MSVLEKDIEGTVVKWAKENGFLALKVNFVENGYPDRMFISPHGHVLFIEFKRPGQEPRPLQYYRLSELVNHGIVATWTNSAVEAINMLRACLEPASVPDAGDFTPTLTGVCGVIPGPWIGKDLSGLSGLEDIVQQGTIIKGVDHCTFKTDVQRVAGGDKEMGEFQQPDLFRAPRDPEGDGPNYGLADSFDQP